MGRYYSSSDGSDYESSSRSTSKSSKSKKKSSRRSRSSSYDSSRKRSSRRSRSSSYDSYSRKRRSSRSSSYERDRPSKSRRRSRSRSTDSLDYRRSKKSKSSRKTSRSRSRSPYRSSKSSKSRRSEKSSKKKKHVDAVIGLSTGTLKDVMDIVPGFSKMTPAEQARIRVQKQLKIAAETPDPENYTEETEKGDKELTIKEQIDRASKIITIQDSDESEQDEDAGFMPSHFRSSKKKKLKEQASSGGVAAQTLAEREGNHELAIFGNTTMLTIDQAIEKKKKADDEALANAKHRVDFMARDPKELASKELLISQEDADRNWLNHLKILKLKIQREGFAIG